MGADLRTDAVLERGNDLAARRIVLGIGGKDQGEIERQPHGIALNLDVALLHDVEEAHLNLDGEVG